MTGAERHAGSSVRPSSVGAAVARTARDIRAAVFSPAADAALAPWACARAFGSDANITIAPMAHREIHTECDILEWRR
jgi:hypothetical protein